MHPPLATGPHTLFAILIAIISTTLLILIFSYLNNVSLVKESVLVCLYKDVVVVMILLNSVRLITFILIYSINSDRRIDVVQAKVTSIVVMFLVCYFLLLINIVNAMRCFILKSKVIDPPMPWGDDNHLGIRIIRASCFVFTTGFVSGLIAVGAYPKIFYNLIDQNSSAKDLPEDNYVFFGLALFLFITATIMGIVSKFQYAANEQALNATIPRQMNYLIWVIPTIIIVVMTLAQAITSIKDHLLQMLTILSIVFTIIPALIIYCSEELKYHSSKVLKNKMEEAFMLCIYVTPVIITVLMYGTLYVIYQCFDI